MHNDFTSKSTQSLINKQNLRLVLFLSFFFSFCCSFFFESTFVKVHRTSDKDDIYSLNLFRFVLFFFLYSMGFFFCFVVLLSFYWLRPCFSRPIFLRWKLVFMCAFAPTNLCVLNNKLPSNWNNFLKLFIFAVSVWEMK